VNTKDAFAYLGSLGPSHMVFGLERTEQVLARLGNPERAYPSLHVAGTNGKGSTCAMADASLRAAGLRTGFYSSPHLLRVNERIRVDGVEIGDDDFARAISAVAEAGRGLSLTYFEFLTAVAFFHFREAGVQAAVLETGLGGRLDSTNVVAPVACAITSIGLDHQQILGATLAKIAGEKAGILKPGVPCAVAASDAGAVSAIEARGKEIDAPIRLQGRDFTFEASGEASGDASGYRGPRWSLPDLQVGLPGTHQRQNAAVTIALLEIASERLPITPSAAREGVATARWPGRLESFFPRPKVEVILDGAHNPDAARALAAAMREMRPPKAVQMVFGVLDDKELPPMLEALFPLAKTVYLVRPANARGRAPESYIEQARAFCRDVRLDAHDESVAAALQRALDDATADDRVLVCGSLYVVAEARARLVSRGSRERS
jgi:dihydrofolate synthase/folylpolyglutamate synthase